MNKISKKAKVGLVLLALVCSGVALASAVTINGSVYSCQNTCVINISGGTMTVSDSLGGWWHYVGPAPINSVNKKPTN